MRRMVMVPLVVRTHSSGVRVSVIHTAACFQQNSRRKKQGVNWVKLKALRLARRASRLTNKSRRPR